MFFWKSEESNSRRDLLHELCGWEPGASGCLFLGPASWRKSWVWIKIGFSKNGVLNPDYKTIKKNLLETRGLLGLDFWPIVIYLSGLPENSEAHSTHPRPWHYKCASNRCISGGSCFLLMKLGCYEMCPPLTTHPQPPLQFLNVISWSMDTMPEPCNVYLHSRDKTFKL